MTTTTPARHVRRRYLIVGALAVLALAVGIAVQMLGNSSAKDRIAADPPPRLFAVQAVSPLERGIAGQQDEAQRRMAGWWKAHGHGRDDEAFVTWLVHQAPKAPRPAVRTKEMADLSALASGRSADGVQAAVWLERNGKKDIWKLYAHDQAEWLTKDSAKTDKADVKAALKLAKQVSDAVSARNKVSAPYVLNRSLLDTKAGDSDPIKKLKSEQRPCPCSYPSRHATKAAAARTILSSTAPGRAAEYAWMESEIDYSRLYMAGHVKSDILTGTLLGDMIGLYIDEARGGAPLWPRPLSGPTS
jgi:membrane-associated phospholipid phosphatase